MDSTLIGDIVLGLATVVGAVIAARAGRAARQARDVGHANADRIERVALMADGRQKRVIKQAVEEVAKEHPELVSEAIAMELVRSVLEGVLGAHLDREQDWRHHRREGER